MANEQAQSIRGNSVPVGGVTATVVDQRGIPLVPDEATARAYSQLIAVQGEYNVSKQAILSLVPGQQSSQQLRNTGLGSSIDLPFSGSISFVNTAVGAQVINFAPEFPFNLISRIGLQFNGQTNIIQMSGYEALVMMAKRTKGLFVKSAGAGAYSQAAARVSAAQASVSAGANATLTAGNALCGFTSVSIAGASTGIVNFTMNLRVNFTPRQDLLLGLLPMQNNSVNAMLTIDTATLIGLNAISPTYVSPIPATLSATINASCTPEYNFFAVSDKISDVIRYMVGFSYQQISVPANTCSSTGAEALQYTLPNNFLLMSMLATIRDGNGTLVNAAAVLDNPYINYNNTIQVDRRSMQARLAKQERFYQSLPYGTGQVLFDGCEVCADQPSSLLTAGWLNLYYANNPQYRIDVAAGTATPLTYSMLREQLVPAQITAIG